MKQLATPGPRNRRGIALITAMLVMALSAIAAAAVLVSAQAAIRRTATLIDGEKAWWYADGLESWVRAVLLRDSQKNNPYDALNEDWAKPVDYLPVEQGVLRGRLTDLQGRFNLNNFRSPATYAATLKQFQQLFANIDGLNASQAQAIAEAIKDWVDDDQIPTGSGGAEDTDYMSLDNPYRAANRVMKSPTELLAVKGMTAELYQKLSPYVTVLPLAANDTPTRVNVNTASYPVLMSLSPNMNRGKVEAWLETRKKDPVGDTTLQKLVTDGTLPPDAANLVTTRTSFFLMFGEAFIGTGRVALYSVLMRPASGPPIVITRSLDSE